MPYSRTSSEGPIDLGQNESSPTEVEVVRFCNVFNDDGCGENVRNDINVEDDKTPFGHEEKTLRNDFKYNVTELELDCSSGNSFDRFENAKQTKMYEGRGPRNKSELDCYNYEEERCMGYSHVEGKPIGETRHISRKREQLNRVLVPTHCNNLVPPPSSANQRQFVVDYANLRRSGYFLDTQSLPKEVPVGLITSNMKMSPVREDLLHVANWVNHLPEDAAFLTDSEDDMGKCDVSYESRHDLWNKYMTDEDHFRNMIVDYGGALTYTSKPRKTLNYAELESIYEIANDTIDAYLDKARTDKNHVEYEFVYGKVIFPSSTSKDNDNHHRSLSGSGFSWLRSWLPNQSDIQKDEAGYDETGYLDEESSSKVNKIVLEPYQGPVYVNGAIIEAGCPHPVLKKGMFGNAIKEVKALLHAIHNSLSRNDSMKQHPVSPASSVHQNKRPNCEDPEIQKLTEMLHERPQKKKTSRSVFGLRNFDKSPQYNLIFRRSFGQGSMIARRRGNRIVRALNGWIQREGGGGSAHYRPRYLFRERASNHSQIERQVVPDPDNIQAERENDPMQLNYQGQKKTFLSSFVSMMKSIVPFQITPEPSPGIPAYPADQSQNVPRNSQMNVSARRRSSESFTVPTRYRRMRGTSTRRTRMRRPRHL